MRIKPEDIISALNELLIYKKKYEELKESLNYSVIISNKYINIEEDIFETEIKISTEEFKNLIIKYSTDPLLKEMILNTNGIRVSIDDN